MNLKKKLNIIQNKYKIIKPKLKQKIINAKKFQKKKIFKSNNKI